MRQLSTLLGLLLLIGMGGPSAEAQLTWRSFDYFKLNGGLNNGFDPTALGPDEASDLQNVTLTTSGAVKKRDGFTPINATPLSATAVFTGASQYTQSDGTRFLIATVSNGSSDKIYKMNYSAGTSGPTGTWDDISPVGGVSFPDTAVADFAQATGSVVIEDGVNTTPPYVWSGSGVVTALSGSPPNSTMVEYHKNVLWVAGSAANPSRVSFSNIGDITTWTATDFINVNSNDGQQVRALKSALDCLYVFKDYSIWRICGADRDNFSLEQMVNGVGTLSNQSVQVINNIFYFATSKGEFARYDGGIHIETISQKIQGTLNSINLNRLGNIASTAFNDGSGIQNYYAAVSSSGSGSNDTILQFNTQHGAWLKFVGINANSLATYELGTTKPAILFGDYTGTANRYPNGASDNGAAINAYYVSGQYHYPDYPQQKTFRLLRAFLNQTGSYTVNIESKIDFEATGTAKAVSLAGTGAIWDTSFWDATSYGDLNTTIGNQALVRTGDFFQWKVSDNSTNPAFTLRGVQVWLEPTERVNTD